MVEKIVAQIKARGLDGIAITEHFDKEYGYKVKEIVERYFDNEVLIIPGQEIYVQMRHEVELYLPNNSTFRFLAHPGYPSHSAYLGNFPDPITISNVQGIEIENGMSGWYIDKELVREVSEKYNLLILRNSDAHYLDKIGQFYNEIDLEELYARATVEGRNG